MKRFIAIAAFAAAGLVLPGHSALAQAQGKTGKPNTIHAKGNDQEATSGQQKKVGTSGKAATPAEQFMDAAAQGGVAEIDLAKLAEQKASSPAVKQFAQRMISDHEEIGKHAKDVAQAQNFQLPDQPNAQQQALKSRLEKLSGAAFDRAYMNAMVQQHTKTLQKFEQEAKSAQNSAVRQFASNTVPVLESHLSEAKEVHAEVMKGGK